MEEEGEGTEEGGLKLAELFCFSSYEDETKTKFVLRSRRRTPGSYR
jgi:hypothetical protein